MFENHEPNLFLFASNFSIGKCNGAFKNSSSGDIQHKNDKAEQQSGHAL